LAALLLADDQPHVLQHPEGGGDGAGARRPDAAGPAVPVLGHLVALHGQLGEQGEAGGPAVAAADAAAVPRAPAGAEGAAEHGAGPARAEVVPVAHALVGASGTQGSSPRAVTHRRSPAWSSVAMR